MIRYSQHLRGKINGEAMAHEITLTKEGLEKAKRELEHLKKVKRPEVIQRIKTAKEFGDLSENAEYEDAKNEQSFIESKIAELENLIKTAKIHKDKGNTSEIGIGNKIVVKCDGEKTNYEIVGPNESDPASGKISSDSPIAESLIGRKKGEKVIVPIPDGTMECEILEIM
jgi:transcription elongation factor GreA